MDAIEEICDIPRGTLRNVLTEELALDSKNAAPLSAISLPPENEKAGTPQASRDIDEEIDWSFEARREVVSCFFTISSDYRAVDRYIVLLVRPSTAEQTYLHTGTTWDDGDIQPTGPNFSQENIEGRPLIKHG